MIKEITIPEIGEKIESGKVVGVLVSKGDSVDIDQPLIEFETDKAVVEIPSTEKGTVAEVTVKDGDEVKIGQVIVKIETNGDGAADTKADAPKEQPSKQPEPEEASAEEQAAEEPEQEEKPSKSAAKAPAVESKAKQPEAEEPVSRQDDRDEAETPASEAPASPSVRRLARELGADVTEIRGTGPGGRITMEDVKAHVKEIITSRNGSGAPVHSPGGQRASRPLPDFSKWGDIRKEPMNRVRSITADSTAYAWNVVPHVTQFDRADVTDFEAFRQKYAKAAEKAGGKLTITAVLLKVMAAALKKYPQFNASIDTDSQEIIYKDYCHIGMAVDTDRGLLVPVLRDVDRKSIVDLAVELTDLAERTRTKKIKPEEMEGGTFTISNQGAIGGVDFTPIVYWPQVAILGVSRSSVQPRYIDGQFEARTILPLSLSYDHRIIDGADAARFLSWVAQALEHPFLVFFEG
ncbi:2-oxo acid dehydrogenase subunit E2 [bacterium]|nr:2-oxo acid dehydrogenase subunit E2 [bacterium]MCB2201940.1 2-oxo acid dehydrogenase subunit E2 [bacterium]